jgi:hypothetical protein
MLPSFIARVSVEDLGKPDDSELPALQTPNAAARSCPPAHFSLCVRPARALHRNARLNNPCFAWAARCSCSAVPALPALDADEFFYPAISAGNRGSVDLSIQNPTSGGLGAEADTVKAVRRIASSADVYPVGEYIP